MDRQCIYEIRVEGQLTERWSAWFEGLAIQADPKGETLIRGLFVDQSALFGVLNKILLLNLVLISVNRIAS